MVNDNGNVSPDFLGAETTLIRNPTAGSPWLMPTMSPMAGVEESWPTTVVVDCVAVVEAAAVEAVDADVAVEDEPHPARRNAAVRATAVQLRVNVFI